MMPRLSDEQQIQWDCLVDQWRLAVAGEDVCGALGIRAATILAVDARLRLLETVADAARRCRDEGLLRDVDIHPMESQEWHNAYLKLERAELDLDEALADLDALEEPVEVKVVREPVIVQGRVIAHQTRPPLVVGMVEE